MGPLVQLNFETLQADLRSFSKAHGAESCCIFSLADGDSRRYVACCWLVPRSFPLRYKERVIMLRPLLQPVVMAGAYFSIFHWTSWPQLSGAAVYLFARKNALTGAAPIYAGETGEMSGYFGPGHRKWSGAAALGATHILVHYESSTPKRLEIETALRRVLRPPLNEQLPSIAELLA
jgi:hypothetical protein